jgi:hypothetical protein
LYWKSESHPLPEAFTSWMTDKGFQLETGATKLLGSAIGPSLTPAPTVQLALDIISRNDLWLDRLCSPLLKSQVAMSLLRVCGPGRAVYLARCTRPSVTTANIVRDGMEYPGPLKHFDNKMFQVVKARAQIQPNEWSSPLQKQIALPLRLGGCGFRSAFDSAHSAWFAAQAGAAEFMTKAFSKFDIPAVLEGPSPLALENEAALDLIKPRVGADVFPFLPPNPSQALVYYSEASNRAECPKLQRALTRSAEEKVASQFSNYGDIASKLLMQARTEKLAHLWKETVPQHPSLFLSDDQYSVNFRVEYGLPPVPAGALKRQCGMCNGCVLAHDHTHFINCPATAALRTRKHNTCTGIIATSVRDQHGTAALEVRNLWNKDRSKPDVDCWFGSRRYLLDFTNRNDLAPSHRGLDVISAAEREKIAHYQEMAVGVRASFVPFVTLAFGGFSSTALNFVRQLRQHGIARDPFDSAAVITRNMCRKIAIAIHRFNAVMYWEGIGKSSVLPAGGAFGGGRGLGVDGFD